MVSKTFDRDFKAIMSPKVFGVDGGVIWRGVVVEHVIFDDESIPVSLGEGPTEIIEQPRLTARASDFKGIEEKDEIQVAGETFEVHNWIFDGKGEISIFMHRTD